MSCFKKNILGLLLGVSAMSYALEIQSHRGRLETQNTGNSILAFQLAVDAGVSSIELDLQLTGDEQVIVFHDDNIDGYLIKNLTLKQVQLINPKINTLKELIDWYNPYHKELILDLELKNTDRNLGRGQVLLSKVLKAFIQKNLHRNIRIRSFDEDIINRFISFNMSIPAVLITDEEDSNWAKSAVAAGASFVAPHISTLISKQNLEIAKKSQINIIPWTVNTVEEIEKLTQLKIYGVTTDRPLLAKSCLHELIDK